MRGRGGAVEPSRGSNVIPRRARPDLAGLRPHRGEGGWRESVASSVTPGKARRFLRGCARTSRPVCEEARSLSLSQWLSFPPSARLVSCPARSRGKSCMCVCVCVRERESAREQIECCLIEKTSWDAGVAAVTIERGRVRRGRAIFREYFVLDTHKNTKSKTSQSGIQPSATAQACSSQGYLTHKRTPTPLGSPQDHRHRPTVGS